MRSSSGDLDRPLEWEPCLDLRLDLLTLIFLDASGDADDEADFLKIFEDWP